MPDRQSRHRYKTKVYSPAFVASWGERRRAVEQKSYPHSFLIGDILEVPVHEARHIVVIVLAGFMLEALRDLLEGAQGVRAELGDDAREQVLQLLGLGVTGDHVGVRLDGGLDLGLVKMNHLSILLEHIHFLN